MNTKSVQVVMSTYNGEKYLKEQIDSILSQEGVDVRLYIRDDGSSDQPIIQPLITPTLRSASGQGGSPGSRTLRRSSTTR